MSSRRVLVVEDEVVLADVVGLAMKETGLFQFVSLATNSEHAIKLWHPGKFCIVVLDIVLPGSAESGRDLAFRFRADDPDVVLVVSSGYLTKDLEDDLVEVVDDFVAKPLIISELRSLSKMWLKRYKKRIRAKDGADGSDDGQYCAGSCSCGLGGSRVDSGDQG
jgi:DNA-binding response OmpR family regulator